jgi:MFS transporter, ACDE family, multidrug resistance protein
VKNPSLPLWRDPVLCFLLICGSLTVMAGAVLAPILPELMLHLHLSRGWAGSLVSAHYLTMAIFSPMLGIWADRWGQVRLLIPCLVAYAVLGVGGAFLPNYSTLLVDRALLGIASGGVAAASLGLLTRRYEGDVRQQAIAYAATIITLANILYPLLSVGLGQFHWRFAFGIYGVGAVLAMSIPLLFRSTLSDHRVKSDHKETKSDPNGISIQPGALLKSPICLRIFMSLSAITAVVYGTIIYLPIYLKTVLGSDIIWNGVILAVQAVGAALSAGFLLGPLTRKLGSLRLTAASLGLMGLFLVLFPHLTQLWVLVLVSSLFGLSFGLVTPSFYSILSNLAPAHLQSSILAAGIGAGFLGQFISPLILGPIWATQGLLGVFYSCAVLALLIGMGLFIPLDSPEESPSRSRSS